MGDPFGFRSGRRLDRRELALTEVLDAVGDPVDMLFDRYQHVRQHGRAARPGNQEQVGEARHHESQIGERAG